MNNKDLCQCNQGRLPCTCKGGEPKQMEVSGKSLEAMYFENRKRVAAYWRERIHAENKAFEAAIRDAVITGTGTFMVGEVENTIEIKHIDNGSGQMFYDPKAVEWQEPEPQAQYTAVDMATAAADGFRDGAKSVVVELPKLYSIDSEESDSRCEHYNRAILLCKAAIIAAGGQIKE